MSIYALRLDSGATFSVKTFRALVNTGQINQPLNSFFTFTRAYVGAQL